MKIKLALSAIVVSFIAGYLYLNLTPVQQVEEQVENRDSTVKTETEKDRAEAVNAVKMERKKAVLSSPPEDPGLKLPDKITDTKTPLREKITIMRKLKSKGTDEAIDEIFRVMEVSDVRAVFLEGYNAVGEVRFHREMINLAEKRKSDSDHVILTRLITGMGHIGKSKVEKETKEDALDVLRDIIDYQKKNPSDQSNAQIIMAYEALRKFPVELVADLISEELLDRDVPFLTRAVLVENIKNMDIKEAAPALKNFFGELTEYKNSGNKSFALPAMIKRTKKTLELLSK